jgi:hypothetical protein
MPILTPSPTYAITGTGIPGTILHDGQVSIGAITFGATDDYGVEWILESLKGWDDPPASTGGTQQRAADHGLWTSTAYYSGRTIEVEGSLLASSWAGASEALDRLWGAIPISALDWLYVAEGARTLCAKVRQDSDPLVERNTGWAKFSLSLIAPDPRRYDVNETTASTGLPTTTGGLALPLTLPLTIGATTTAGVLTVTNAGNMATRPTFTVDGPVPAGASITHRSSGKTLRIPDGVPSGRTLTIDTDKRTALLDGTAARVVTGTWFEYDPGSNDVAFSAPSYNSTALLTSVSRSAWR